MFWLVTMRYVRTKSHVDANRRECSGLRVRYTYGTSTVFEIAWIGKNVPRNAPRRETRLRPQIRSRIGGNASLRLVWYTPKGANAVWETTTNQQGFMKPLTGVFEPLQLLNNKPKAGCETACHGEEILFNKSPADIDSPSGVVDYFGGSISTYVCAKTISFNGEKQLDKYVQQT